jgi:hypothetical protein
VFRNSAQSVISVADASRGRAVECGPPDPFFISPFIHRPHPMFSPVSSFADFAVHFFTSTGEGK